MEVPVGRSDWDPGSFAPPAAIECWGRGAGCCGSRYPTADCGHVSRCRELTQMVAATAGRWLSCAVGSRKAYVVRGEQMGLTASDGLDPHRTALGRGQPRARARWGSATIQRRPHLSTSIVCFYELKVLAGWRSVGVESVRLASGQAVNESLAGGSHSLAI